MSILLEAPPLNPLHRYLKAAVLHFRRFVNRSVASMLATWARRATRFVVAAGNNTVRERRSR